jgi:CspA family cold shock protein
MQGTVDRVVPAQGFGFIRTDDGQEFFFHRSALKGVEFEELAPGSAVVFEVQNHEPGDERGEHPRAVNVNLAPDAVPAEDHEALPAEKTR